MTIWKELWIALAKKKTISDLFCEYQLQYEIWKTINGDLTASELFEGFNKIDYPHS